jgi:hypothetical protein
VRRHRVDEEPTGPLKRPRLIAATLLPHDGPNRYRGRRRVPWMRELVAAGRPVAEDIMLGIGIGAALLACVALYLTFRSLHA